VGAFTYSAQEGTHAALLADDVPEGIKRDRLERLTERQRAITAERYEARLGGRVRALVERSAETAGEARAVAAPLGRAGAVGRLPWQADDIDGVTWLDADVVAGSFVEVEVTDVVDDYDFRAHVLRVLDAPEPAPRAARSRVLPLATVGSYGR
jgi:ribosomal protein S12 methylthiotransferase